jgi:phenylalanyl-tRNA synthetase alpha subunit
LRPTAEEQQSADQQRCAGFGYQAGTDAFAQCMMKVDSERQAQAAADRRAAEERAAQDRRAQEAQQAAKEKEEQEAKQKAEQDAAAKAAASSTSSSSSSNPVDDVRNKIEQDMQKMENMQ